MSGDRLRTSPVVAASLGVAALVALGVARQLQPIASGDLRVSSSPLLLPLTPPRELAGPARQICLVPSDPTDARALSASDRSIPDRVVAVLIRTSGERDTLGGAVAQPLVVRRTMRGVCLSDRGLADLEAGPVAPLHAPGGRSPTTTYRAVELRSAVPIRLRAVSLWAGRLGAGP